MSGRVGKLVCLCLLLALAACASLRWQKPQVALDSARVLGGNLQETRLQLTLRVRNPNARDVLIESLRFDVLVAGERVASGQRDTPVAVLREADTRVELEVRVRTLQLMGLMGNAIEADGTMAYTVEGEAEVRDLGTQRFSQRGSMAVPRLLQSK